jgi:hypothetical protein
MAAGFSIDAAVMVHFGVTLALVGTDLTGDHAGMKLSVDEFIGCLGLPREHASRGHAHIGAREISGNAAAKLFELLVLAQACVCTRDASFRAGGKGPKRLRVVDHALLISARMTPQHHFNRFHLLTVPRSAALFPGAAPV